MDKILSAEYLIERWKTRAEQLRKNGREIDQLAGTFFAKANVLDDCVAELEKHLVAHAKKEEADTKAAPVVGGHTSPPVRE